MGLQHLVDFPFDSLLTFLRRAAFLELFVRSLYIYSGTLKP